MSKKILPIKLTPGDTIGLIAPSGVIKDIPALERAVKNIESRGYKVKLSDNITDKKWYFAGDDQTRLKDLMTFFKDPEINAIFCARGGYGCTRLLDKLDFEIINLNPKILLGYSDITAFHFAINKYSNLITFHGPLSVGDFGKKDLLDFTWNNAWMILENNISFPHEINNYLKPISINSGKVYGQIVGGNLAVICSIMGSKYFSDFDNKILFIEDVSENLYRIDRYLIQLKLAGVFNKVKGIIFGEFTDLIKSDDPEVNNLLILDIIKDIMQDIKTPAIYGFSCGHAPNKSTIPFGAECHLDASEGILTIVEPFLKST
ncbi:MAG: LD-carboxypeptidase [Cyanobacteriota bacterium]